MSLLQKILSLCVVFGVAACAVEDLTEPASSELGASSQELQKPAPDLEAASCSDCSCPLGQRCSGGTCSSYPVFGPVPMLPGPCVCDAQCAGTYGGAPARCTIHDYGYNPQSYGYCVELTCSISWDHGWLPLGWTANLTVNSSGMPPGAYSRLWSVRDGAMWDTGQSYPVTAGVFPITNTPGHSGTYFHWITMHDQYGAQLCYAQVPSTITFQ